MKILGRGAAQDDDDGDAVHPSSFPFCWPGGGVNYVERIQLVIPLILSSAVPT
jgi:hypothetical protein